MATNVQDFIRLKETIIRMNLDKDAAEGKAEQITVLLKEAQLKQEEAEKELAVYMARVQLRKEKLKTTETLLKDTAWKVKIQRQEIRKRGSMIIDLKSIDTTSGREMQVAELSLKQARRKAGESRNRLQDVQKRHQTMKREIEACHERTTKAEQQANLLQEHLMLGQARHEELSKTHEEGSEKENQQLKTISNLEKEITQANNRTESANRESLVKNNEMCRLRTEIEKYRQEKAKVLSTWTQMGNLANEFENATKATHRPQISDSK